MKLELPMPPEGLRGNRRVHWAKLAQLKKDYRWEITQALLERGGWTGFRKARAIITFRCKTKRRRDVDNYSAGLKALWDEFVHRGILIDDDEKHLEIGKATFVVDREQDEAVIINLEEIDEPQRYDRMGREAIWTHRNGTEREGLV